MNFFSKLQIRIMDYVTYLCQIKISKGLLLSSLLLINSCSQYTTPLERVDAKPNWFNVPKKFTHKDDKHDVIAHPFFDLVPFPHGKDNGLNVVMTTMEGSLFSYGLDIYSGKLFKKHNYCEQEDVWQKYSGDIYRPPFSEAVVPRLLDQLGTPQRVLVFGKRRYFPKHNLSPTHSQRVRVVGGFVEQYCKNYPCLSRENWLSRLVLVAVNGNDPEFKDVFHIKELKSKVDWSYVKAFAENGNGRTLSAKVDLPSYRMVGNIGPRDALSFALKKGLLFKYKSLNKMRKSCHKLYDYVWSSIEYLRNRQAQDKKLFSKKRMRKKKEMMDRKLLLLEKDNAPSFLKRSNVVIDTKINPKKGPKKPTGPVLRNFAHFMKEFSERYKNRFNTCTKFVRSSSINDNIERHWFFVLFSAFYKMESLNFVYHCPSKAWIENPLLAGGKRKYDSLREIHRCTTEQLDVAFDSAVTLLTGRSRSSLEHYRYIQYDDKNGGTHQKLYSWIYKSGKNLRCERKVKQDVGEIFPQDIFWKPFGDAFGGKSNYIR